MESIKNAVEDQIAAKPWVFVACSLGTGFLIGLALGLI